MVQCEGIVSLAMPCLAITAVEANTGGKIKTFKGKSINRLDGAQMTQMMQNTIKKYH